MRPFSIIVGNRYQLKYKLGQGGYGMVRIVDGTIGNDVKANREVAIKLEHDKYQLVTLACEFEIYQDLAEGLGIPAVYDYFKEGEFRVMIIEALGPSLQDLFSFYGNFSVKTVFMLADQLLQRLENIHAKGYLHRDIKPGNLLMGVGGQGNTVYVVDMGIACQCNDLEALNCSITLTKITGLAGTMEFASIADHQGRVQHRRDDLESLGYVLLYLLTGDLPWMNIKAPAHLQTQDLVLKMKRDMVIAESFPNLDSCVSQVLSDYFNNIRSLELGNKSSYDHLRRIFGLEFERRGYEYDNVYDWTTPMFVWAQRALGSSGNQAARSYGCEKLQTNH